MSEFKYGPKEPHQDSSGPVASQQTKSLQEDDASFLLLFTNNPQPMWVYDLQTLQFLEVNDAAISHYGYSRHEFLAM
jgi:PAS domain-containing protein